MPGDLRPTGTIAEPILSPPLAGGIKGGAKIFLPLALIAVCAIASLLGGIGLVNSLLAGRTPQPTTVAAATQPPNNLTTEPPNTPTTQPPLTKTPTPTHTPVPTLGIGSTQISEKDSMVMVYVPEGEFLMGATDTDAGSDEKPQHTVYLDAFWIDQTEVTNDMFAKFIAATSYETDAEKGGCSYVFNGSGWDCVSGAKWDHPSGPNSTLDGLENHPVVHVSWNDATAYCEWAGRRLPTEAQWEKAASWDELQQAKRKYPWGNGNVAGNLLNFADSNLKVDWADKTVDDGYQFTAPVGTYPDGASPYGALDMAGNVWEWVNDWYGENYYNNSPSANPPGPTSGDARVLRGGCWYVVAQLVRASYRNWFFPVPWFNFYGFRCSR